MDRKMPKIIIIFVILLIISFFGIVKEYSFNSLDFYLIGSVNNLNLLDGNDDKKIDNEIQTLNGIKKISELNKVKKELDSNKNDTKTSVLELNYREILKLKKDNLDGDNDELNKINYARLKKLHKSNNDYEYILTFQNLENSSDNGTNIYYTRSSDLKKWEKPHKLFENYTLDGKNYLYSSCDSIVLNGGKYDGRIIVVVAKVIKNTYNFSSSVFNTLGIYIKYSDDNGDTWSNEEQIYSGYVWEPYILQLSTGDIQVYFTDVAPVEYMKPFNSDFASTSPQFNSSGVGMISSFDGGETFIPNVKGTTSKYVDTNIDYYAPYRIAQQPVFWCKDSACDDVSNEIVDFTNIKTWNSSANKYQYHHGIDYNNQIIKMTDQMPVAVELNNREKIVMAAESIKFQMTNINVNGEDIETTKLRMYISLAYSNKKNVLINGINKQKYWLDITNSPTLSFSQEKDVYNSNGLLASQTGPVTRNNHLISHGAAPYILQMPSGETILYYKGSSYPTMLIGDSNGNFSYDEKRLYTPVLTENDSLFGSIANLSSHSIALLAAQKDSNGNKYIGLYPMYLNHTIDIKNTQLSETNDDALFIGSDSQAQASIRANYDLNNIYFYVDTLDRNVTNDDSIDLYVKSANMKYNNNSYDYLHMKVNSNNTSEVELVKGTTKYNLTEVKTETKVLNTGNDEGGYIVKITIPRSSLNLVDDSIKINAILNNCDSASCNESNIIHDTLAGVSISDYETWINVNLVSAILKGDVNNDGVIDEKDTTILAKYIVDGTSNVSHEFLNLGDMNNDGKIKMNDVMMIVKLYKMMV